jgi:protein-tyrosine-phosphatase
MKRIAGHLHLDLSAHKSRRISRELLDSYDLVLVMESNHREALLVEFPEIKNRLFLLSEVTIGQAYNIPDPHAQPGDTFQDVATELQDLIDKGYKNIHIWRADCTTMKWVFFPIHILFPSFPWYCASITIISAS